MPLTFEGIKTLQGHDDKVLKCVIDLKISTIDFQLIMNDLYQTVSLDKKGGELIMKEELEKMDINKTNSFESSKILSLNKFFMKHVVLGLIFSFILFVTSILLLIFIVTATKMDESVKITIISMVATFILTIGKSLIERLMNVVVYVMRLLGEEQRGLNKKIGVEIEGVEFEFMEEQERKE